MNSALKEPQDLDAEQAVLGSVLKSEQSLHRVIEILAESKHFHSPKNRLVYQAVLELYEKHEPCDITTVTDALRRNGDLDKIGGRVYLVDLAEGVASTANVAAHARIVLEKSLLRRLVHTSEEIIENCYSMQENVSDLLDTAESRIFNISQERHRGGFKALKDIIPSTFEQIEEMQSRDSALSGLSTGFTDFDVMTNGLHKGELIIIAGRPSMGKSALVMNIAEHVAIEHHKVIGVFSVEMSAENLALRMVCGLARIS
ncbi:MAG: replicative DNA helicase, partial [candidate division Zixibacteria bacterium]|nr:replicative DNA helicase [candidate division Zixibacteria bacterium]